MINPGFFGADVERLTRELGGARGSSGVVRERRPRQRRPGNRVRLAVGRKLIVWGESLACDIRGVEIGTSAAP